MTLVSTKHWLIFCASLMLTWRAHSAEPVHLRILSYNIHHGEGIDSQLDLQRLATVILSVKPDLVALQEVDRNVKRTGGVDQPAELARLTKMSVAFGANIELQGGHYGNAVLSRLPIASYENYRLPNLSNGEQRGVLAAEITLPQIDQPLLLLATHFDHRSDDSERLQSAEQINAMVVDDLRPAVFLGDLNDVIGSKTLNLLETLWRRTNDVVLPTIPVGQPSRQIDFILVRPANRWEIVTTEVLHEAVASDHRAILAELRLIPE